MTAEETSSVSATVWSGLLPHLAWLRSRAREPRLQRWVLAFASIGFTAGVYLSIKTLPADLGLTTWTPLALSTFIGVPLAMLLTVVETWLTARVAGTQFGWKHSVRVSVLSSAANMLPLPGGALVRVAALRQSGAAVGHGAAATIVVAVLWLGIAFVTSGLGVLGAAPGLAVLFGLLGIVFISICSLSIYIMSRSWVTVGIVMLIKLGIVMVDVARMRWTLAALDLHLTQSEAMTFALSGVAGAAVSVVPAGLGVTESVAALLAPLSTIPSSAAFLAASINRAAAFALMAPVALAVSGWLSGWRRQRKR